jgi:hypothetical protein
MQKMAQISSGNENVGRSLTLRAVSFDKIKPKKTSKLNEDL